MDIQKYSGAECQARVSLCLRSQDTNIQPHLLSGTGDRYVLFLDVVVSLSLFLAHVSVRPQSTYGTRTVCVCVNTIAVQTSAAPLVFTNIQHWPLLAPAPGYTAVNHGPPPQAFRILGGRCLRGDFDQTKTVQCYQSFCTSVCTVWYKSQQL